MQRAELHSHSTASDGAMSPTEVAELCAEHGVEVWALTDHDTCRGCQEARAAAERLGMEFIPGIEMSAYADRSIHVLGYGVDPNSEIIHDYSERRLHARRERMRRMVGKMNDLGVEVTMEDVERQAGNGSLARPHLANALVDIGAVEERQEAFDRYIKTGGPAYVTTEWPSVSQAIDVIHEAGGVAVLAHPGRYSHDDQIPDWIRAGLDGLEVRHPSHDPDAERRYRRMADEHDLLMTESSDFHGHPDHHSWERFGDNDLPEEMLENLYEAIEQPNSPPDTHDES